MVQGAVSGTLCSRGDVPVVLSSHRTDRPPARRTPACITRCRACPRPEDQFQIFSVVTSRAIGVPQGQTARKTCAPAVDSALFLKNILWLACRPDVRRSSQTVAEPGRFFAAFSPESALSPEPPDAGREMRRNEDGPSAFFSEPAQKGGRRRIPAAVPPLRATIGLLSGALAAMGCRRGTDAGRSDCCCKRVSAGPTPRFWLRVSGHWASAHLPEFPALRSRIVTEPRHACPEPCSRRVAGDFCFGHSHGPGGRIAGVRCGGPRLS